MAYTKTNWEDRLVEFPNRYAKSNETSTEVTLTAAPGMVTRAGTPISAANMNKIEQGIADAQTPANILAWLKTVDGAGSGLDADTLDGIHASTFAQRTGEAFGGSDLNNFTISGFYRLGGNLVNAPSGADYGQMLVVHGGGDTILQVVSGHSNGMISFRTGNPPEVGGPGSWTAWMNFYHTDYKPSVAGTYTGDGSASRTISLPFTPSAVLVFLARTDLMSGAGTTLATTGVPSGSINQVTAQVTTNGFIVYYGTDQRTNVNGLAYNFVAFR